MNTNLNISLASQYKSKPQAIRIMTEYWVTNEIFCPNCGDIIYKYVNNKPVGDFYCQNCLEDFELKSKKELLGKKIVNGSYKTMIERLRSNDNPNFFFLVYTLPYYQIKHFMVIPKHFFIPKLIEKRPPLSKTAKRAGWIGCNILLQNIPESGKIYYIKNGQVENKKSILKNWHKTLFLRDAHNIELKGWTLDIMRCIDILGKKEFTLKEIYLFEQILAKKYPYNKHIKDKIRQQLQFLRDKNYIEFISPGVYRLL